MAAVVRSLCAGSDPGGKYDATQFVRKAVERYAAETGCRTRRRIDQEPNRGRAGSARDVRRCDRDRQLLAKQQAGSSAATRSTNRASFGARSYTPRFPVPAPLVAKAKAKAKKRRAATLSYVNREYGLSFSFPRNYQLKAGKEDQVASRPEPLQMNFVHPGGVALAALEMPGNSYPGTDFKSASLNVSVNPGMTSEACAQFAVPEPSTATDTPSAKIEASKIGAIEFHTKWRTPRMMKAGRRKVLSRLQQWGLL